VAFVFIATLGALPSCGDWVSLGPLVECGRRCEPPYGASCEFGIAQYNRAGECVCGKVADCRGYVCKPSPPDPTCYIAQYAQDGSCECTVLVAPGTCGQPCKPEPPDEMPPGCPFNRMEYDGSGACVCAPAVCPCGHPCRPTAPSDCYLLHQYDEDGQCVCAPVACSACEGNPCCHKPCGDSCSIPGCEGGAEACAGQCDKKSQCVAEQVSCNVNK
jgi:hypothetical protein